MQEKQFKVVAIVAAEVLLYANDHDAAATKVSNMYHSSVRHPDPKIGGMIPMTILSVEEVEKKE